MSDFFPLQTLRYAQRRSGLADLSDLDAMVDALIKKQTQPFPLDEVIDTCQWEETLMSAEVAVKNWKQLLIYNLLGHFDDSSHQKMAAKVYQFERHPWNQNSQYFRVLVALNHILAKMPVPDVTPHLLKGGAALIELQEYCPWLAYPSIPHHLEFGIFLSALALLNGNQEIKEAALRLARWQLNTLDANFVPLPGLFVQEVNSDQSATLILYYLLYRGVSKITRDPEMGWVADRFLSQIHQASGTPIDPLWVLLEKLFTEGGELTNRSTPFSIGESIFEPSTALIGYRSAKQHAVCTLHGFQTGLGTHRLDDVEILNYGPQYLPLGECNGFGIEGNPLFDDGQRRPILDLQPQGFILKGCVRLVDQPAVGNAFIGKFRGIWLEIVQEFKYPHFNLQTSLLGLDGWEGVAFTFFVKAKKCIVDDKTTILPKTLNRYEGSVGDVILEGERSRWTLKSPSSQATLQIIPLAGEGSFWGADFLVAYLFHPDQRHYNWNLIQQ